MSNHAVEDMDVIQKWFSDNAPGLAGAGPDVRRGQRPEHLIISTPLNPTSGDASELVFAAVLGGTRSRLAIKRFEGNSDEISAAKSEWLSNLG